MNTIIAVDVGGTFTDVSILGPSGFTMWKVPSTPDPVDGVMAGIHGGLAAAGISPDAVWRVLHATTVATNAIFERTGAPTGFLTTEGFGDVVLIGREVRSGAERFQITLPKPDPFVSEATIFEVPERVRADGSVHRALDEDAVRALAQAINASGVQTLAVSLLHSYRNPTHERRLQELLAEVCPSVQVMLSCEVCPEPGEYERAMTTIVSAYISPLVGNYLERLQAGLHAAGVPGDLIIIGSDGAGMSTAELVARPVACLESGPVAGVLAGRSLAQSLGLKACLTLDIGGTTSKAGIVLDGRIELTKDFRVGGPVNASSRRSASAIPVRMPVVDLAELGVGGGSIAWADAAGGLRVGPNSVGATPGPACFGTGGDLATVTDAAVVTGIIAGRNLLGSERPLDVERARTALGVVGAQLGLDPVSAAVAAREVASAEIAAAVRRLLFYRGVDPADLTLIAFGGTGPLHAAEVAEMVGIGEVLVPRSAGVFTTFGLLSSELGIERSAHLGLVVGPECDQTIRTALADLEAEARAVLLGGNEEAPRLRVERSADMRFRHQVQTLALGLPPNDLGHEELAQLFREEFARQFGLSSDGEVELVQLQVRVIAQQAVATTDDRSNPLGLSPLGNKEIFLDPAAPVRADHLELVPGGTVAAIAGPAVIDLLHTSVLVLPGWTARSTEGGDLTLRRD